jgi:hypothetical protein
MWTRQSLDQEVSKTSSWVKEGTHHKSFSFHISKLSFFSVVIFFHFEKVAKKKSWILVCCLLLLLQMLTYVAIGAGMQVWKFISTQYSELVQKLHSGIHVVQLLCLSWPGSHTAWSHHTFMFVSKLVKIGPLFLWWHDLWAFACVCVCVRVCVCVCFLGIEPRTSLMP